MKCRVCEHCGCSLDFGEKCDCQNQRAEENDAAEVTDSEEEQEKEKARCA